MGVAPKEIVFIGSSPYGLRCLAESPHFTVREALCLTPRVTRALEDEAAALRLPLSDFDGPKGMRLVIQRFSPAMPFFIYQLDMLVPADLTNQYSFYNVHRGDLHTNRGPTPDIWPILNGDKDTALSLHKINDKVDAGILIDAIREQIREDDDARTLRQRVELHLPRLIQSMHDYLVGERKGIALEGGLYRPWIAEEDFTIDIMHDSIDLMMRKIRCQRIYNGAIVMVDGVRRYVTDILGVDTPGRAPSIRIEGPVLQISAPSRDIAFVLNENPKYPPPPIRPPSKRV